MTSDTPPTADAATSQHQAVFYKRAGLLGGVALLLVILNAVGIGDTLSQFFGGQPKVSLPSPVPGLGGLPTPTVPQGTLTKIQKTGEKAVDVTATAVDTAETVIDSVDNLANDLLGSRRPPTPPSPPPRP